MTVSCLDLRSVSFLSLNKMSRKHFQILSRGNKRSGAVHTRFSGAWQRRVREADRDQSIRPIDITSWNKMAGAAMLRTLTGIMRVRF